MRLHTPQTGDNTRVPSSRSAALGDLPRSILSKLQLVSKPATAAAGLRALTSPRDDGDASSLHKSVFIRRGSHHSSALLAAFVLRVSFFQFYQQLLH